MSQFYRIRFGHAYLFALAALAFLGWGLYSTFDAFRPPSDVHVRLASGSTVARRFQIAEALSTEARKHSLNVEVVATKGFEDSIRQISQGNLQLAMASSGLETGSHKQLQVLAGLDVAPLHILVRKELEEQGLSLLKIIKGRRVNLGPEGTNDNMLGGDVLRFLHLTAKGESSEGDYTLLSLSKEQLSQIARDLQMTSGAERQALAGELPDVIMTVASLPGVLVQALLNTGEYSLMPFPNVEPYLMSELHHEEVAGNGVDRIRLEPIVVHSGMYVGDSAMPRGDCPTVGLRTLLVARPDLSAEAIHRVMQAVFETDFAKHVKPQSPRSLTTAYQIHPAAERYLDRDKPLITGTFFESVSKFLSIFGAFSAGALSLYGYLRRRRIRKPGEYLEEIRKIDALASTNQTGTDVPWSPELLARELDTRLNQLKEQVIRDYCENRVQGEMVLLSILSTLADSRSRLHVNVSRSKSVLDGMPSSSPLWASVTSESRTPDRSASRVA